ncbi:J domain-containing protein [Piscinibacter gummiphilus]|uniref:Uncharacterized protein n=1 Tax=Piscinibacter gummiphilus TaxID=946333 RepID=A0A1W6L2D3_9BURK|nr:J domain-containing protein [Piscinibacter gummiphilus]ARN18445.1 hypothetical protein A4W93_00105 [Piscinibacter gummiphilus]ATU63074.1 J domain-containing protein [Piscinibacter gummiphilus]GLS95381.1 hypothetical protein GCM10007918_26730 [Piscinibacter gummiphilus]
MFEPQRTEVVPTATTGDGRPLTPAQKRFQTLVTRIEAERRTLSAWQSHAPAFRQAYSEAMDPLVDELDVVTRQWAFALDGALAKDSWTATQRTTLRELLCEAAANVLAAGDDAELKALFDKHADVEYDTEQRIRLIAMMLEAEAETGLDLGDDDIASEEELDDRIRQSKAAAADAAPEAEPSPQAKPHANAAEASRSLREIYRKLASALHPDRESDPVQRETKTAQMQRVNQAYDSRRKLPRQVDIPFLESAAVVSLGRNLRGGSPPRAS